MTQEEIVEAISDDKMMPFIQTYHLSEIVDFVIKNYKPSPPSNLDEAARMYRNFREKCGIKDPVMLNEIEEAHYAGAEWMANSGIVTEAFIRADGMGAPMIHFYDDEVKELIGDKVVVQIRKK